MIVFIVSLATFLAGYVLGHVHRGRRRRLPSTFADEQRDWIARKSHDASVALCAFLGEGQNLAILAVKRQQDANFAKNTTFRRGVARVVQTAFMR